MARTYVIAEAGVNHNGSIELARRLVDAAVEAGADAVKFQTFKAERLVTARAAKAAYQDRALGTEEPQLQMLRKLELTERDHATLASHCASSGIEFLSTPFDVESIAFLVDLGVRRLKVSSGDLTNLPLLRAVGATRLPCILSTGMGTLGDVEGALGGVASGGISTPGASALPWAEALSDERCRAYLERSVALLHCTTEYPAPFDEVNLRAMDTLAGAFALPVGYSDHTVGIAVPIAAVARGATVIEKHFTLDRSMEGPDHAASLVPSELTDMVTSIRQVERALGSPLKRPTPTERRNVAPARRSLVAAAPIARGERFSAQNVTAKRPGTGISPMCLDEWIGRPADRDYEVDDAIGTPVLTTR